MKVHIFKEKKDHELNVFKNTPFFHGGQGRAYIVDIEGNKYLLKVFPSITNGYRNLYSKPKILRENIQSFKAKTMNSKKYKSLLPSLDKISFRGLPLGIGYCSGLEFFYSSKVKECVYFLFNFIEGQGLDKYLNDSIPAFSKVRLDIARQALDLMSVFSLIGVIQADMTPDNFIINKNNELYPIDLESVGLMIINSNNHWRLKWRPGSSGKPHLWPIAPELQEKSDIDLIDINSGTFTGIYLLFWIITGFKPLDFMLKIDQKSLNSLKQEANKTQVWPPLFKVLPSYVCPKKLIAFQGLMNNFTSQQSKFGRTIYKTLVNGLNTPSKRASMNEISKSLKPILNN